MSRHPAILLLVLVTPLALFAEKKPEFPPLQSCYDGPISEPSKGEKHRHTPPRILHSVDPEYTEEARKAHIQGTVWMQIVLTPQGKVCPLKILRGLTTELDQNAAKVVERWIFRPAEEDGVPVAAKVNVEVVFRLY